MNGTIHPCMDFAIAGEPSAREGDGLSSSRQEHFFGDMTVYRTNWFGFAPKAENVTVKWPELNQLQPMLSVGHQRGIS